MTTTAELERAGPEARSAATLPGTVALRLREMIIEGRLAAGARLSERTLCDQLGISRTPLREALRLLSGEGLVALHPNRGAHVVSLSAIDIRESFEVMSALEALSGELAGGPARATELAPLRARSVQIAAESGMLRRQVVD